MTCQVRVIASDGSTTIARALLDLASSTSFVSERLVQRLHLRCQYHCTQISVIGGITVHAASCEVFSFMVSPTTRRGKVMLLETVVFPKVTTNVQSASVHFDNWKHFLNIQLAHPDSGTFRNIDLILGADVFSCAVLYGWHFRPPGSPSALMMAFEWVLTGTIDKCPCKRPINKVCCLSTTIEQVVIYCCRRVSYRIIS